MTQAENLRRLILSPDPVNRQLAATILQGMPELKAEVFPNIPDTLLHPLKLFAWNRPENWVYIGCQYCAKAMYIDYNLKTNRTYRKCTEKDKPLQQCTPCREFEDAGLPF